MPTPHNSAKKGDFAKTVLMPGDPLRAKFIAETFLDEPKLVNNVRGELNYIMPNKPNASIHIDTFHDYEPCILARYLKEIPEVYSQLDDQFLAEHGLCDLMDVVHSVPPLRTDYVPRDSIVREFVGGSCFEY